jgi:serine O-acetyltransferase
VGVSLYQATTKFSVAPTCSCCSQSHPVLLLHRLRRREAERDAAAEPLLSSFLYATILAHDSFERALAFVLSNRLANAVMLPTQLFETFHEVLVSEPDVRMGALADVEACRERVRAGVLVMHARS